MIIRCHGGPADGLDVDSGDAPPEASFTWVTLSCRDNPTDVALADVHKYNLSSYRARSLTIRQYTHMGVVERRPVALISGHATNDSAKRGTIQSTRGPRRSRTSERAEAR